MAHRIVIPKGMEQQYEQWEIAPGRLAGSHKLLVAVYPP